MRTLLAFLRELWHLMRYESDPLNVCWNALERETRKRQREREERWRSPTQREFVALLSERPPHECR